MEAARKSWHSVICDDMVSRLFAGEARYRIIATDDMVTRCNDLLNWPAAPNAFQFRTVVYIHSLVGKGKWRNHERLGIPVLAEPLVPDMSRLLDYWYKVEQDRQRFKQIVSVMIGKTATVEEARQQIPDVLLGFVPQGIRVVPRSVPFETATHMTEDQMAQWQALLPTIQMYIGSSLLS